MAKKNNNTLLLLGVGALLLLRGGQRSNVRYFRLPNGQSVPETALPSLGYVKVNGQWYPASGLNQGANINAPASQWQNWINAGIQVFGAGVQLWDLIQGQFGGNNNAGVPVDTGINDPFGGSTDPLDPNYNGTGIGRYK